MNGTQGSNDGLSQDKGPLEDLKTPSEQLYTKNEKQVILGCELSSTVLCAGQNLCLSFWGSNSMKSPFVFTKES